MTVNRVDIQTGKLFEAFYISPDENLSIRGQQRRMEEKQNFFGSPLIYSSIGGSQSVNVSLVGLSAFEMDVDYLYDKKIITDVPYNRLKTIIQEYKDELESLNTQE